MPPEHTVVDFSPDLINDLIDYCIDIDCNKRILSILIFCILKFFDITNADANRLFQVINCLQVETIIKQLKRFIQLDTQQFVIDGRGGKHEDSFYDVFPYIKIEAKSFVAQETAKTKCSFRISELAKFISKLYYEEELGEEYNDGFYVRSETSCRVDLERWGYNYDNNKKKAYFLGHEREDVIEQREEFINYFINSKDNYYVVSEDEKPEWIKPIEKPCVLIFHDESTFRSGEQTSKRWLSSGNEQFYNKGRGRSIMVSDFLVAMEGETFFSLSTEEWNEAIKTNPELKNEETIKYEPNTATAMIDLSRDGYFNTDTILAQFERLFKMIKFKKKFNYPVKHDIELIVDNARTHSALMVNINDFRLRPGGYCPLETLTWEDDNGEKQFLDLYFKEGDLTGQSKGLKQIALDLGFEMPERSKLEDYKRILSNHKAFQKLTKLQELASRYKVKIIYCPKYHCELNPIEGVWCWLKQYIRRRTDQTYDSLVRLLDESREEFETQNFGIKLIRRFWRCIFAYKAGLSYREVLTTYFSGKSKVKIEKHRRIQNTLL